MVLQSELWMEDFKLLTEASSNQFSDVSGAQLWDDNLGLLVQNEYLSY